MSSNSFVKFEKKLVFEKKLQVREKTGVWKKCKSRKYLYSKFNYSRKKIQLPTFTESLQKLLTGPGSPSALAPCDNFCESGHAGGVSKRVVRI